MSELRPNDLSGVVLPYLSIDEFVPKVTKSVNAIVIAFYCLREEAASDLKSFIDTGKFNIIDVEKSDVPDEKNRFLVFVEVSRDVTFFTTLFELIRDIENITDKMRWVFSSINSKGIKKLTPKTAKSYIILDKQLYIDVEREHERKLEIKNHIKSVKKYVGKFVLNSNIMAVDYKFINGKKTITFHYTDSDFDGSFNYQYHGLKSKAELKEKLKGVQGKDGEIPFSILKPLKVLFGDLYTIHNYENIIMIVPKFDNEYVLLLGV